MDIFTALLGRMSNHDIRELLVKFQGGKEKLTSSLVTLRHHDISRYDVCPRNDSRILFSYIRATTLFQYPHPMIYSRLV